MNINIRERAHAIGGSDCAGAVSVEMVKCEKGLLLVMAVSPDGIAWKHK